VFANILRIGISYKQQKNDQGRLANAPQEQHQEDKMNGKERWSLRILSYRTSMRRSLKVIMKTYHESPQPRLNRLNCQKFMKEELWYKARQKKALNLISNILMTTLPVTEQLHQQRNQKRPLLHQSHQPLTQYQ